MNENKIDRKIAVIFVTDVVGFSKLMEKNEDQTLKSFRSFLLTKISILKVYYKYRKTQED